MERQFDSFAAFRPELLAMMQASKYIPDCVEAIRQLGIIEPFTERHYRPEEVLISSQNYREELVAEGCLSRHRAILMVLQKNYTSPAALEGRKVFLAEAFSGFARRFQHWMPEVVLAKFLEEVPEEHFNTGIRHEDLCDLSFSDRTFDLVVTNDLFQHVPDLKMAFAEIFRVLIPGGRMVCTFPFAYGQYETVQQAIRHAEDGRVERLSEQELHGDPIGPGQGAVVYQVPGWSILDLARAIGFAKATMHVITSWKYGVLGSEIPAVFVMEVER